jgi:two-component system sensor histidine kinase BarA
MASWGIRTRVLLLTIVPTLTISILLGFYFISMRVSDLDQNLETRGESYISQLSLEAGYGLFLNDKTYLQNMTDSTLSNPDVDYAGVYTNAGEVISYTGSLPLVDKKIFEQLDYIQHNDVISYNQDKDVLFVAPVILRAIILPNINNNAYFWERYIENKDKRIGWVVVRLSRSQTVVFQNQSIVAIAIIILIGLVISILFGLRLGRDVTSPLLSIINVVKRIRDGKLDARVEIDAPGEMRTLEEGINAMAQSLLNSREEMQENIQQATAELRNTLKTIELQNTELDVARNQALEASRIKSAFLANMSHEIRTPMNGVIGFTNLLFKTRLTDQQREFVNTIQKSSKNLLEIINNILDLSKIEADKLELEQEEFNLYAAIEDVIMLIKPLALEKGLTLDLDIPDNLPSIIIGDQLRLTQVLTNLLGNAIKFTSHGGVLVTLKILRSRDSKQKYAIEIRDTGIGMSKQQIKKLFEPFSQADSSTTRKYGGTGLGLAISKRIIEKMDGDIQVESEYQKGSLFRFTFVLEDVHTGIISSSKPQVIERALVWDQSRLAETNITRMLNLVQVDSDIAESEESFIDLLADPDNKYDYILLGIHQLYNPKKLKAGILMDIESFSTAKVIILAYDFDYKIKEFADEASIKHYVSRPFRLETLSQVLAANGQYDEEEQEIETIEPKESFKVLVVDDNEINLKLLTMLLYNFGATVVKAKNGKEAVDIAKETAFDLVLLDLQMPEVDGFEACKLIREIDQYIYTPIIALSADVMGDNTDKMLAVGFTEFYSKPIGEDKLSIILNKYIFKVSRQVAQGDSAGAERFAEAVAVKEEAKYIDMELGKSLANGNVEMAKEMLALLIKDLPENKQKIRECFNENKLEELQSVVHKLHGGCCYCGVPILKDATDALECDLKAKLQKEEISEKFNTLIQVIDKTLMAYEERIDN